MIERLLLVGLNHRLVTLMMLVVISVLSAQGLPKLRIDTGLESLVSDSDPDRQAYLQATEEFGSDNRTLIYVRDPALWTPLKLEALQRLQNSVEQLDVVERVESILTLRTVRGRGETLDSRPLLAGDTSDAEAVARARADALANPLLVGNFVSRDGNATAIMVSLRPPTGEADYDLLVNDALDGAIASEADAFAEAFQIGPSRINAELKRSLFEDLRRLAPLSAALLVLAILLFLGSVVAAVVPLLTAALSVLWTFGLMGHLGIPLNILSAMLPSLVVVIGSTEDTHMMATYLQSIGEPGEGDVRRRAVARMMRRLGAPLFLTVLTTALGFASNVISPIGLIRDFSLVATFAILANGLITIALVPMLLSVLGPRRGRRIESESQVPGFSGLVVRLFGFGRRRLSAPILLFTAALTGFFIHQASSLVVTNDPFSYLRDDNPLVRDAARVQAGLAGVKIFYVMLESDRERAFLEPANLRKLADIQRFIARQGVFDSSLSLADYLSLVNREYYGGDPSQYTVPRSRELAAQYLLFFHRRDVQGLVSPDLRRATILVRHNISDSRTLNEHVRELRGVVTRIAGADMTARVLGENLMINAAAEQLMRGQAMSLGLLLVVIFVLMSAMFTSFKGGFVSLVPSVIPIVLMFGVMGLLDIPLNPGTAMVAAIAIGIAIDGTIHLFSRYNQLSRQLGDNERAVQVVVGEEAIPVLATSIALSLGFGVLLFSRFSIVAQFGALSAATMLFAVFANLLITPIIMSRIRLVGLYDILAMSLQHDVLRKSPLFRDMSGYQIRKAILISELQHFAPGEFLIRQHAHGRSLYLVLSGEVEVVRHDGDQQRRIAVRGAGEVFGEVGYVREIERTADVRALTEVQALRFDFERMRRDLHHFPRIVAALNFNISRILGERLAEVMNSAGDAGHGVEPGPAPAPGGSSGAG